jgi:hypothetical protein
MEKEKYPANDRQEQTHKEPTEPVPIRHNEKPNIADKAGDATQPKQNVSKRCHRLVFAQRSGSVTRRQ